MDFPRAEIKKFFDVILAGESKTYNDHNYYTNSGLKGYIQNSWGTKYSPLKKDLSQYTIGEVKSFQANSRDSVGQLWATGRYQIIPDTLKGVSSKLGLSNSDLFNEVNQDKMAIQLLYGRTPIKNYITGAVADNKENLEKASLSMAQIWSSIGVPYAMQGRKKWVNKNESYYSGGGDKAHITTEATQEALKKLRKSYKKDGYSESSKSEAKKSGSGKGMKAIGFGIIFLSVVGFAYGLYYFSRTKK